METKEKTLKNTHHGHAIKRIRHTLCTAGEAVEGEEVNLNFKNLPDNIL
jgi:hypothetical protein